ncbi:Structural maintenance of chromosomes protein 5 [Exophiala dermatitidis]
MAPRPGRRSRALDSDDEDSRADTPSSTARNDSKRQRRTVESDHGDHSSSDGESTPAPAPVSLPRTSQMSARMSSSLDRRQAHQPGAIVRVKLTDFVTYTSAEFFPGPNLNMVIGPNGTGKSTLVCAICLGLGWPPSYLGRAKEPGEFVKHGHREATIEIELQRKPNMRKNPIITRVIKREGNKSVFTLNGAQSTGKAVQTLANSFNIQIDNLCQFLPQDKVVEFAQMSPIELLASTQRAVSGPDMSRMHEDLKRLRSSQTQFMNEHKQDRDHLANLENRQEMQRTEVERMRERALVQKRLEWLNMCRPAAQYTDAKTKYQAAKDRVKVLTKELKHLKATAAPMLEKWTAKEDYVAKVQALKLQREEELSRSERTCDNKAKALERCEDQIRDLDNKIEAEKKTIPKTREELKRLQHKILELRRKREQKPEEFDSRALAEEIQELKNQQRALDSKKPELEEAKDTLREKGRRGNQRLADLNNQLAGLETHSGQQEGKLQELSRDTFQAWKWIQENQEEFKQHVFGPPIVECSLKDPRMADAIESLLQDNDFKFITVQNQDDFRYLQGKLFREKKYHDISLRVSTNDNLDQFRPPLSPQEMERYGLTSWALDNLEGPPTVLAMLCMERSLHRSGISSRELTQQQHDELAKTTVQSYVVGRKSYQFIRRAEYGAAGTSARVREVRPARRWTDQPVDMGRKATLQRDIAKEKGELQIIKEEFDNIKRELAEIEEKKRELEAEANQKREEKDARQRALMEWRALEPKIQDNEQKVKKLQETLDGFRERVRVLKDQKDDALVAKTEALLEYVSAARVIRVKFASLLEAEVMLIEAKSDLESLRAQNAEITKTIEEKSAEETQARTMYQEEFQRAKKVLAAVKKMKALADELVEKEGDRGLLEVFTFVAGIQNEEDLDAEIDAEKAKLELTEGGSASIIRDFEERARVIERLRAKLADADARQEDFKHSIREIRNKWEHRLDEVVSRINDAFSDSFARIGCAGQVAVYKASSDDPADCTEENGGVENGLDFANWAIHISVKFREQEPLSLLDSHRQSGGERAVSTIFYLMALQSLSRAPFRVVDEINQGMDPRNERMVHGRMVDIAADDGGSQYFLITPKLLSGLKYRRGMTVLCIVSGENMPAARERDEDGNWVEGPKVDFRALVERAKQLGTGAIDRRRVDSGVSMGLSRRSLGNASSQVAAVGA